MTTALVAALAVPYARIAPTAACVVTLATG